MAEEGRWGGWRVGGREKRECAGVGLSSLSLSFSLSVPLPLACSLSFSLISASAQFSSSRLCPRRCIFGSLRLSAPLLILTSGDSLCCPGPGGWSLTRNSLRLTRARTQQLQSTQVTVESLCHCPQTLELNNWQVTTNGNMRSGGSITIGYLTNVRVGPGGPGRPGSRVVCRRPRDSANPAPNAQFQNTSPRPAGPARSVGCECDHRRAVALSTMRNHGQQCRQGHRGTEPRP